MNTKAIVIALFVSLFFVNTSAKADFTKVNVQQVPLLRLIQNQTKAINEDPSDPHGYYALGRLYAMAYSQHSDTVPAIKRIGEEDYMPFYGYDKRLPHFFIPKVMPKDTSKAAFMRECLQRATASFKNAVLLDSNDVPSYLGLAWCIQHSGNRDSAINAYRTVLAKSEALLDRNGIISIETAEISSYLISLLDKEKNKKELEMLSHNVEGFVPNYLISPILVPLQDDVAFENLIDTTNHVSFNLDGKNNNIQWQWISPKAAWLVYLDKATESVKSGVQLFGSISYNISWENGYQALALLDDNRDGYISGKELRHLALWNDKNSDGISTPDELQTLEYLDVEALYYKCDKKNNHLYFNAEGLKFKSGKTRPTYDWFPRGFAKGA